MARRPVPQTETPAALEKWSRLCVALEEMNEEELFTLLEREKHGSCRRSFLLRIYGRANKLRAQREASDLVKLSVMHVGGKRR